MTGQSDSEGVTLAKQPLPPPPAPPQPPPHRGGGAPAGRGIVLVVGVVVTAMMLAWGTLQVAAGFSEREVGDPLSFPAGIRRVVADLDAGSLEIRGGSGAGVTGTRHRVFGVWEPQVSEHVDGDTLRISSTCSIAFLVPRCGVSYSLDVPRDVSLDIESATGRVLAERIDGDVRVRSAAGRVEVDDMRGALDLHTSAGRIDGTRLHSTTVDADASAGAVQLDFAAPPEHATVRSSAGRIRIAVPRSGAPYRVEAESSAGRVDRRIESSPSSDRVLDLSSSAGSIEVLYGGP